MSTNIMQSFFFGSSERQLFGKLYAPAPANERDRGIVLCQSLWMEYVKAHRATGYIAQCLAEAGFHTLLFDYFSTGDSAGDCGAATTEAMRQDIRTAVDELCDSTGITSYGLIGIRFGAALAANCCRNEGLTPFAMAFWDPVATGSEFMQQITTTHAAAGSVFDPEMVTAVSGFPVTKEQLVAICSIDETEWFVKERRRSLSLFSSKERKDVWEQMGKENCVPPAILVASSNGDWFDKSTYDKALIPKEVPRKILEYFLQGVA